MKKIIKYIMIFLLLIVFSFIIFLAYNLYRYGLDYGLANGYILTLNRRDDRRIWKDEKVVVAPTVIDVVVISDYVVGLRMPVQHLECDGGHGYKIRTINERKYFILFTDNGEILNFVSRKKFEVKLKELNIFNDVSPNYSKFDILWKSYSDLYKRVDFSTCVIMGIE